MSFISSSVLRAAAVTVALGGSVVFAAPGAIYNLGTLGGTSSSALGVNDAGQVAGYSATTADVTTRAFRYDYDGRPVTGGVMIDLGTLNGAMSRGHAVNNLGQVAGWGEIGEPDLGGSTDQRAFRYDGTPGHGVMHDLGTLGGRFSRGFGINDAGQVAGHSTLTSDTATRAFRYDGTPGAGGVMHNLGTLGGTYSAGAAVNNAGQVVGISNTANDARTHAFRYDGTPGAGGVMLDLGTLGGGDSEGTAVNNAGQVTGYSWITGDAGFNAFRYDGTPGSGGVMRDLGTLGGLASIGTGINDAGQVVGRSVLTGNTVVHAFLYTGTPGVDGQMIDLDAWLDATNPTEGAKWTLTDASDISNTGWITGVGTYNDGPGGLRDGELAFLLDASSLIPEPGAVGALAIVAGAALLRRWRG